MNAIEKEHAERDTLHKLIDEIVSEEPNNLARAEELGAALSFKLILPHLETIIGLYGELKESKLEKVPLNTIGVFRNHAQGAINIFKSIKDFQVELGVPGRDRILNNVSNHLTELYSEITPYLAYSTSKRESDKQITKEVAKVKNIVMSMSEQYKEGEIIINTLRESVVESGVASEAKHFSTEASEHDSEGKKWLISVVCFGLATFGLLLILLYLPVLNAGDESTTHDIVTESIVRLLILSLLYFGMVWSSKNYLAHRHNVVVNKHRANALKTFQSFVEGAEGDAQTKYAVLIQATTAVFSPQKSGFLRKESETQAPNRIIEILQNISSSEK